ncbi:hypothetical protein MA5S0422_2781 [Mycobacteroides abscessus 5S-0422]|nr:hypothetical protein MA5S0422_2781 [Mycobacteroides abscessus 5S-0422]
MTVRVGYAPDNLAPSSGNTQHVRNTVVPISNFPVDTVAR